MVHKSRYNPFRIPFSTVIAQQHSSATSAGIPSSTQKRCACCLIPIQQTALPINFDLRELGHLGYQYRQLYECAKIIGFILMFLFVDSGVSQLQDSLLSYADNAFQRDWSTLATFYSLSKFWLYSTLSFVSLTFLIILLRMFQTYRQNNWKLDKVGQQSWSILLKNVPKSLNAMQKIRDLFKSNFDNVNIKQIILLPNMQSYTVARQQIIKQVIDWKQLLLNQDKKKQQILQILKKIQLSTKKFNELKEQVNLKINQNFCGNAIVVFQTIANKNQVLKAWQMKFFTKNKISASFGSMGQAGDKDNISAEQAPSPSEIIWENICLSDNQYKSKTKLSFILMILLQIGFFLFYFVSQLCIGRRIRQSYPNNVGTVFTLVLVSILSFTLLPWVIQLIQKRQRQPTLSKFYQSIFFKLSFSLIIIKSLAILGVESTFNPGSQLAKLTINKIVILSFCDLVISLLFWLINPKDVIKRIRKMRNKKNKITQQQANNLYLKPAHDVPLKYSFLLHCFWAGIMFSNLAPVIIMIQLVCVFGFFWFDKINLAKRSSVQFRKISTSVFVYNFVKLMEFSLIFKPLANLFFWSTAHQMVAVQQIIMLVFGIAYNCIPKQDLTLKLFTLLKISIKQYPDSQFFDSKMDTLYCIQNPITGGLQARLNFIHTYKGQKIKINNQSCQLSNSDIDNTLKDRANSSNNDNAVDLQYQRYKLDQIVEKVVQQTQRNMFN